MSAGFTAQRGGNRRPRLITEGEAQMIRRGISRTELARRLRVSPGHIKNIINRGTDSEQMQARLETALGCTLPAWPRRTLVRAEVERELETGAATTVVATKKGSPAPDRLAIPNR